MRPPPPITAAPSRPRLALLSSERPRNVGWLQAAGLLFGDWGTSRLYVLGLALLLRRRGPASGSSCAMSLLILAVGWAYTQICRIYPDGGGVYTAAKQQEPHARRHRGAAAVRRLHRHRQPQRRSTRSTTSACRCTGTCRPERPVRRRDRIPRRRPTPAHAARPRRRRRRRDDARRPHERPDKPREQSCLHWDSPGLWAIVAIGVIGAVQPDGPEAHRRVRHRRGGRDGRHHAADHRLRACRQVDWRDLPQRIAPLSTTASADIWVAFVSIVLALSGVEAIANLTGVMKKPVAHTARKAIWVVAGEVGDLQRRAGAR